MINLGQMLFKRDITHQEDKDLLYEVSSPVQDVIDLHRYEQQLLTCPYFTNQQRFTTIYKTYETGLNGKTVSVTVVWGAYRLYKCCTEQLSSIKIWVNPNEQARPPKTKKTDQIQHFGPNLLCAKLENNNELL